jgi:hypothetical protein
MAAGTVGVSHVPRSSASRTSVVRTASTGLVSLALAATGVVVTGPPASAGWSFPGDLVKYRVCRHGSADGESWVFRSRVKLRAGSKDGRGTIAVYRGDDRVARWSSGWLDAGEVQISEVRVRKSPKVRVFITQEAGDRDSDIGTSAESNLLKPWRIRHCG